MLLRRLGTSLSGPIVSVVPSGFVISTVNPEKYLLYCDGGSSHRLTHTFWPFPIGLGLMLMYERVSMDMLAVFPAGILVCHCGRSGAPMVITSASDGGADIISTAAIIRIVAIAENFFIVISFKFFTICEADFNCSTYKFYLNSLNIF